MDISEKLTILTDSAKYDVACTSSGSGHTNQKGTLGNTVPAGICHSFAADGRCISLLKILMTNYCVYDCHYCVNRRSNDIPRAVFTPQEVADLTIEFYRRNYIEGLFLSSGVIKNPDYTMELLYQCLRLLRETYRFGGYIHAKAIPGASPELITLVGSLVDRMSVNLELPSEQSLRLLAPDKAKRNIFLPMGQITRQIRENKAELSIYRKTPSFAPAGQSTQMIIGASPETDYEIVRLTESLYSRYELKRVFFSAYIPVGKPGLVPQGQAVPLLREHRLYQADWLLRFYGFQAGEILSEKNPHLDPHLDPKANWAIHNLEAFPVEVNKADYDTLLRVPGIGVTGAKRILTARRIGPLHFDDLKKMRIVLKRAAYFITCSGKYMAGLKFEPNYIYNSLVTANKLQERGLPLPNESEQLSFFAVPSLATALKGGNPW